MKNIYLAWQKFRKIVNKFVKNHSYSINNEVTYSFFRSNHFVNVSKRIFSILLKKIRIFSFNFKNWTKRIFKIVKNFWNNSSIYWNITKFIYHKKIYHMFIYLIFSTFKIFYNFENCTKRNKFRTHFCNKILY